VAVLILGAAGGIGGALARRLAGIVSLPLPFVEAKLQKLAARKYIRGHEEDGLFTWRWDE